MYRFSHDENERYYSNINRVNSFNVWPTLYSRKPMRNSSNISQFQTETKQSGTQCFTGRAPVCCLMSVPPTDCITSLIQGSFFSTHCIS